MIVSFSLWSRSPVELLHALQALPCFTGPAAAMTVDSRAKPPSAQWIERWCSACKREVISYWSDDRDVYLEYNANGVVRVGLGDIRVNAETMLAMIARLPWSTAAFQSVHPSWYAAGNMYLGPGFGDKHFPHGWACGFKGEGHDRLVSRRWLDFGPWRLLRDPAQDVSFVQFHDLSVDAATALAQARPGHRRMGISDTGGFIQFGYVCEHDLSGVYEPHQRVLKLVVHGREVAPGEMLDACAARLSQPLGPDRPVDDIVFVLMEEGAAEQHLHELWLRGLGCAALSGGREVRLDLEYSPIPHAPDWCAP